MLDVVTRWSSTYFMLRRAFKLKDAINSFTQDAKYEDKLGKFKIKDDGWKQIEQVLDILEVLISF